MPIWVLQKLLVPCRVQVAIPGPYGGIYLNLLERAIASAWQMQVHFCLLLAWLKVGASVASDFAFEVSQG